MSSSVVNQAHLFLIFILNGIIIGILFDIFRILRRTFKTPNIITYIEDILFWLITVATIMYSIFTFNNGEFRAYIFIGIFLGIAIYMLLFSKYVIKIAVKITLTIKHIILFVYHIISIPIKFIIKILNKLAITPIHKLFTKIYTSFIQKLPKKNKISQE